MALIRLRRGLCTLLLPLLASACSSKPVAFEGDTWKKSGIEYSARHGDPTVCPAAVDSVIEQRAALAELWQQPALRQSPLRYYKYRNTEDFSGNAGCLAEADACFDGDVKTTLPVDYHELAHAWQRRVFDPKARWLSEGLATALSCSPYQQWLPAGTPLNAALGEQGPLNYHAAGRLALRLLELGSVADLAAVSARVDGTGDQRAAAEAAVRQVYSRELTDIWAEAAADSHAACWMPGACVGAPVLGTDAARLETSCSGPTRFTLDDQLAPALGLSFRGTPPEVLPCQLSAPPHPLHQAQLVEASATTEVIFESPMEPQLLALTDRDASLESVLTLRAATGTFLAACSLEQQLLLARPITLLLVPERAVSLYFSLSLGDRGAAVDFSAATGVALSWCPTCDACQPVDSGETLLGDGALRIDLEAFQGSRTVSLTEAQ